MQYVYLVYDSITNKPIAAYRSEELANAVAVRSDLIAQRAPFIAENWGSDDEEGKERHVTLGDILMAAMIADRESDEGYSDGR